MVFTTSKTVFLESKSLRELQEDSSGISSGYPRTVSPPRRVSPVRTTSPVRTSSPVRIRNRMPTTRKKSIHINPYSLHENNEINTPLEPPTYFMKTSIEELRKLNVETTLDNVYELLDIYINFGNEEVHQTYINSSLKNKEEFNEATVVLKVKQWNLDTQQITEEVRKKMGTYPFIKIENITVVNSGEIKVNSNEAAMNYKFRVCVNLDWKLLKILGKHLIYFDISSKNISNCYRVFFETFRYQCRNEPILNTLFNELIRKIEEETKGNMWAMMNDFLEE